MVDKFYEVSIVEKDKVLEVCEKEKVNGVVSIASDVAVPVASYVAQKMGLVGNSIQSSLWATNKNEMRKRFKKFDLPIPGFCEVKCFEDAKSFLRSHQ